MGWGANVNKVNADGQSVLVVACKKKNGHNIEVVRCLLAEGADPGLPDDEGRTPLIAASEAGLTDVVKVLLDVGKKKESTSSPLHDDVEAGDGIHKVTRDTCALSEASKSGHLDIVGLLLDHGADPNPTCHQSPLLAVGSSVCFFSWLTNDYCRRRAGAWSTTTSLGSWSTKVPTSIIVTNPADRSSSKRANRPGNSKRANRPGGTTPSTEFAGSSTTVPST